jgi:predicted nucleic acid-binding protein
MATIAEALVVDASVAAKWHLQDEVDVDQARQLFDRFVAGQVDLWAPSHIRYEVPSVIAHATIGRAPRLSREVAQQSIAAFLALGIQMVETTELLLAAFLLVHQLGIAYYDGLYVGLAEQLDLPFITADRRLYERIRHLPNVVWLGSYAQ